ncbi:DUF11 domain-containing protein [Allofranklinella schreckenbergeri]|uniref:DUF11 domain-containing protein n=1 Tax=Allofranklinella schreckenbergeri TaxID=1076744 RepID=A0A3M6R9K7_9BURK|nr:DUF11 domain-containing protein [Allofranklinella schreckenbergeri]
MSVNKVVDKLKPQVGSEVVFTLSARNDGPSPVSAARVTDLLPSGYTFVSAAPATSYDAATGVWTVGALSAGSSRTLRITAKVNATGSYANTAEIAGGTGDPADPKTDNNSSTVTPVPVAAPGAPLIDAVNDSFGTVPGDKPTTTASVLVGDTANGQPATGSNVTLTPGKLSQPPAKGSIKMNPDGTLTIEAGTTPGDYEYSYKICLVAASTVCDSATATVVVAGVTDMGVLKTVEPGVVAAGDKVTFTITVKNHGPSDALDVQVTEALPSGYTLVSATPSVGTFAAPIWKVGTLVNGASATLKVVATVNATGDYLNVVTVSTASSDSVHANNQASVAPPSLQRPTPPASAVPVPANAPWAVLLVMLAMWMLAYRARFGRR